MYRARLGEVLYVVGIVIAIAIVGIGLMAPMLGHGSEVIIVSIILAAVAWGIGYAFRYILAGR